jgi:hypothetical protein
MLAAASIKNIIFKYSYHFSDLHDNIHATTDTDGVLYAK